MSTVLDPTSVFTPTSPAIGSEVYTRRRAEEEPFRDTLREAGTQVLVYGDVSVGKTTFVLHEILQLQMPYIRVECSLDMNARDMVQEIGRLLSAAHVSSKKMGHQDPLVSSFRIRRVRTPAGEGKKGQLSDDELTGCVRDVQDIAGLAIREHVSIIVDSFERAHNTRAKDLVASLAKMLSDAARERHSPRILIIGISESADELLGADSSISRRVQPIEIPRMLNEEMMDILLKGFNKLGIDGVSLLRTLVPLLGGFPGYAHMIGIEVARAVLSSNSRSIDHTSMRTGLKGFVAKLRQHDRLAKCALDVHRKTTRFPRVSNGLLDTTVHAVAKMGTYRGFTVSEAFDAVKEYVRPRMNSDTSKALGIITHDMISTVLRKLSRPDREAVLARSGQTGQYHFRDSQYPVYLSVQSLLSGSYLDDDPLEEVTSGVRPRRHL